MSSAKSVVVLLPRLTTQNKHEYRTVTFLTTPHLHEEASYRTNKSIGG